MPKAPKTSTSGSKTRSRGTRKTAATEDGNSAAKGKGATVGITADISGRAKHFYSIYSKMTKKGREFNEIYDLTAMRAPDK
jgi:GTP diphosphokinase / guanosine-3',5'-bis(diphosphate) 3'-diphosphatase